MKKTGNNSFFKKTSKPSEKSQSHEKTTQLDKLTSGGQWRKGSKDDGPSPKLEREVTHLPNLTDSEYMIMFFMASFFFIRWRKTEWERLPGRGKDRDSGNGVRGAVVYEGMTRRVLRSEMI